MFSFRSGLRFSFQHWKCPNREWGKDHFSKWIMASETTFDHRKVVFSWGKMRRSRFSQNLLNARFWAFGFLIYTSSSANLKKSTMIHFFVSLHIPATSGGQYSQMASWYCAEYLDWTYLNNVGKFHKNSVSNIGDTPGKIFTCCQLLLSFFL